MLTFCHHPARLLTNLTSDIWFHKDVHCQAVVSSSHRYSLIAGACVDGCFPSTGSSHYLYWSSYRYLGAPSISCSEVRVLFRKAVKTIDWLNKVINETILGAMLIRVLNSSSRSTRSSWRPNRASRDIGLSITESFLPALIPVITFVSKMAVLTILVLESFCDQRQYDPGSFCRLNSYISLLIFPIIIIGFMSNSIAYAAASYQRVQEVLGQPEAPETGRLDGTLSGKIAFKEHTPLIWREACFACYWHWNRTGIQTAIIGPTAAGKTQLLYLLTGLINPDAGEVLYDENPSVISGRITFNRQIVLYFRIALFSTWVYLKTLHLVNTSVMKW